MKFNDKIINDFLECWFGEGVLQAMENYNENIKDLKQRLKQKGYEVEVEEEPKSKLEEAREVHMTPTIWDTSLIFYEKSQVEKKIKLYEQAIKELQNQLQQYENHVQNCIINHTNKE